MHVRRRRAAELSDPIQQRDVDVVADPDEVRDLAAASPERVASLEAVLETWMRAQGAASTQRFESQDAPALEQLRALGYID